MLEFFIILILIYFVIGGIIMSFQETHITDDEEDFFNDIDGIFYLQFVLSSVFLWPSHIFKYYYYRLIFSKWWSNHICAEAPDDLII